MDRYLLQLVAIRAHNDELRTHFRGGVVAVSDEVKELGDIVVAHALLTMTEATEFDDEEHACGRFPFCARLFRWWISYENSPSPAGSGLTKRKLFLSL
jgi:hypothetical protein